MLGKVTRKAEDGFCAVKNAAPAKTETPQHVKRAISDLHTRWLLAIGAKVAPKVMIEINPMFAADVESLENKIPAGTEINETTYFQ